MLIKSLKRSIALSATRSVSDLSLPREHIQYMKKRRLQMARLGQINRCRSVLLNCTELQQRKKERKTTKNTNSVCSSPWPPVVWKSEYINGTSTAHAEPGEEVQRWAAWGSWGHHGIVQWRPQRAGVIQRSISPPILSIYSLTAAAQICLYTRKPTASPHSQRWLPFMEKVFILNLECRFKRWDQRLMSFYY